ncbi:hypothetical protein, partial [Rouxiella badensis]|uniref:hypothetical protein n=1 Tax=Rouxiella badensis TaxID=1646377 RepID=UPI0028D00126
TLVSSWGFAALPPYYSANNFGFSYLTLSLRWLRPRTPVTDSCQFLGICRLAALLQRQRLWICFGA